MEKRYKEHNGELRPLCVGDNNKCSNLADYKETRQGVRIYKSKCGKHRRPMHSSRAFVNPRSKRYIPMEVCSICPKVTTLERHRVMRGMPYTQRQVVVLCQDCHTKVHKFETVINGKNFFIKRRRMLKNKIELPIGN